MINPSRNHHYIPQIYLRGFLDSSLQKEQLHVIDRIERRHFISNPRNIGSQRDFNRVDIPGMPIDEAETGIFSPIDGRTGEVLKYITDNAALPIEEDMFALLCFVALLFNHNPQHRSNLVKTETEILKRALRLLVANREKYESQMQTVFGEGNGRITYEATKQFVEEEDFEIKYRHGHHLKYELGVISDVIVPLLFQRKWALLIAGVGVSDFVCSDRPVALITIGNPPQNRDHPYYIGGPGLAQTNTELSTPLNRNMALIGTLEGDSYVTTVDDRIVAEINTRTIHFAARQIYCSNLKFKFSENGELKSGRDLVDSDS